MTLDDTEIIKTAIGWVATIGTTLTGTVGYLFFQVVSLNRKVGHMESEIHEYKKDIEEYKNCPIPQCYFRIRRLKREETSALPITKPSPA
jgi:hypothetical protein